MTVQGDVIRVLAKNLRHSLDRRGDCEVFSQLKHHRFLLEYDDERSGSFAPLKHVRKGAVAVLGLVTTKRPDLEPFDLLRRRLDEASRHLPIERLALSPQCGFGGLDHLVIPEQDQWRKFKRTMEVADATWGRA